jgi:hypothetical protein
MNGPKRIVVEYEDGTRREAPFDGLSGQGAVELSALGLCDAPPPDASKGYLLLQWKDGWKEVTAVDNRAVEVLRYYTIERTEEVGRLSVEMGDAYSELKLIKRLPGRVESILFVGRHGPPQAYVLEEKTTVREGGKTEHIFYDKKRPNFAMENGSAASARYSMILDALRKELEKRAVPVRSLLGAGAGEHRALYGELARALGLRGTERQQDVYGFLHTAIEKLGADSD